MTADTRGNLVIAVPSATSPGVYTVRFDLTVEDNIRTASLRVSVVPAAPVPAGSGTPVILLNGWQAPSLIQFSNCPTSSPDGSEPFGTLPRNLPVWTAFFDNCVECPNCPIEMLGARLGQRINSLVDSEGNPVSLVDVVAHSMGGLIVRAYLSGKSQTPGVFAPPSSPRIRKAVFIGTPHFGSFLAPGLGDQTIALRPGSQFTWDLSRWNQGTDDLREVDALSIAGNGGRNGESDGVVSLTSASIGFAGLPDVRTRVVNGCHIDGTLAFLLFCSTSQGIASMPDSQQIVASFLAATTAWASIGHPPSQDAVLSHTAGRLVSVANAGDATLTTVNSVSIGGQSLSRNSDDQSVFYNDSLPVGSSTMTYLAQGQNVQLPVTLGAGSYGSILVKNPPVMTRIRPAAGEIGTLNIAPDSLISIFGIGLASSTVTSSFPWPTRLADVTLTANGKALQLLYVGSTQINAYFPSTVSGLVTLQLTNSLGQHSLNVMATNASPALFSADSSGTGIAAAVHAATGQPVTPDDPATGGEYIELFGTGFGATHESGGFEITSLVPVLRVADVQASVTFCGVPQGGVGLYQVNFIVPDLPPGTHEMDLSMGSHTSNRVTLPIR